MSDRRGRRVSESEHDMEETRVGDLSPGSVVADWVRGRGDRVLVGSLQSPVSRDDDDDFADIEDSSDEYGSDGDDDCPDDGVSRDLSLSRSVSSRGRQSRTLRLHNSNSDSAISAAGLDPRGAPSSGVKVKRSTRWIQEKLAVFPLELSKTRRRKLRALCRRGLQVRYFCLFIFNATSVCCYMHAC